MRHIFYILFLFIIACSPTTKNKKIDPVPIKTIVTKSINKPDHIQWKEFGFKSMFKAKVQNKFVILYIYSDNCLYCKYMNDVVYNDPSIVEIINKRFIAIKLNGEKNPEVMANFVEEPSFPTTVFLNPAGISLASIDGSVKPEAYKKVLNVILEVADSP